MIRVSSCLALKDVDVDGCSVWTDFLIWYSVWQPWFCELGVGREVLSFSRNKGI